MPTLLELDPAVTTLQQISARRLLAAMTSAKVRARAKPKVVASEGAKAATPATLTELIRRADNATDGELGLTVSFEKVRILDAQAGGFDWGRGEVYVVTSILDGSGTQPDFKTQLFEARPSKRRAKTPASAI